jgi:ribosomal 50S subunit-recycling heat shock protein
MRLDLYLKASRLVLRRTLAQQLCEAGRVKVNDLTAKSSREIKPGDEIEIRRPRRILKARVLEIPKSKQVSREQAATLYEIVSEETPDDSPLN